MYTAIQISPNNIVVDLIGKFFITPPLQLNPKKKDAPVDRVHPLLRVLLPQMRHPHTHQSRDVHWLDRANLMCSGT